MAVSSSFHRNVLLLTQVIAPSEDFRKYFREGMFDKPNTTGFIYVSQYLLTVYDADTFKKAVQWPIICKKTEAKYRNDIKDYLTVIANDNPDIGFPPVLTSYLFHATGTKFVTIMWKLSQVALRTYLRKERDHCVLSAPQHGSTEELAKKHLKKCNTKVNSEVLHQHRNLMQIEETVKHTLIEESEALAKVKAQLFETKESIAKYASEAPIASSIKKHLTNIEDTEIIEMWKKHIADNISYIQKKNLWWKNIEHLSEKVVGMVTSKINDVIVLDGEKLPRIDNSQLLELPFFPDIQYLIHHLYIDDKLVMHNFILLLSLLICQFYERVKKTELQDPSNYLLQIEASCEDIKSLSTLFNGLVSRVTDFLSEAKLNYSHVKMKQMCDESILPMIPNVLLMPSPVIKINTNCSSERHDLLKRLELTPVEGAHKSLFSRYERHNKNHTPFSESRANLLLSRINLDDTTLTNNSGKSPRLNVSTLKKNKMFAKETGKYSRLFCTYRKKNDNKANCSIMSMPCSSKANSTAIDEVCGTPDISLNDTLETLSTPDDAKWNESENTVNKKRNENVLKQNEDRLFTAIEKPEISEVQTAPSCTTNTVTKPKDARRLSIGDLVQRYKKLLEDSNRVTKHLEAEHMVHEDE